MINIITWDALFPPGARALPTCARQIGTADPIAVPSLAYTPQAGRVVVRGSPLRPSAPSVATGVAHRRSPPSYTAVSAVAHRRSSPSHTGGLRRRTPRSPPSHTGGLRRLRFADGCNCDAGQTPRSGFRKETVCKVDWNDDTMWNGERCS